MRTCYNVRDVAPSMFTLYSRMHNHVEHDKTLTSVACVLTASVCVQVNVLSNTTQTIPLYCIHNHAYTYSHDLPHCYIACDPSMYKVRVLAIIGEGDWGFMTNPN